MGFFDFLKGSRRGFDSKDRHADGSCACERLQADGNTLLAQGNFPAALIEFRAAIRACPTNYKAWGNSGVCLREMGRHDEAMAALDKAISLKPDYGIAWENKGLVFARLRRDDEALSCYKTAWKRDPRRAAPHVRAARIYIDRRQFEDAIARCNAALAAEPESGMALSKLALALHEKGDRAAARHAYERALRVCPRDADLLNNFGTLFEDFGDPARAVECYRKALEADPAYEAARLNLGRVQAGRMSVGATPQVSPREATAPTQSKRTKDSVEHVLQMAQEKGLVPPSRDLGMVAEIMPMFDRAARMFHGVVVEAMGHAAAKRDPTSGLAVMQRACMYLFGKGVQAVMVWGTTSDGKCGLDFEPSEMLEMELGPSAEISSEANQVAADAMRFGIPLFSAHQSFMEAVIPTLPRVDEAFVRGEMLKTLQWVPKIAISYALMKGYHRGVPADDEEDDDAEPEVIGEGQEVDAEEAADFEGRQVRKDLGGVAVTKIVDSQEDDRIVWCARLAPTSPRQESEFRESSAAAYELYVITDQDGEILEINHRVAQCKGARRSFAPRGAPVHMFPAGAMFDLEWEDIAPSAQVFFAKLLSQMTESL